ncbi:MAG: sigma-E processing peptidase SpoIIGA [Clostridia bacterium]|nr:sigma-E processing peptidase SpoIIGA [Clostridia bacterium]
MVVYIEYAFAENFLIDLVLSYLSLKASKSKIRIKNLLFSAFIGGAFALVFPLLTLPEFLAFLLKFSVGLLLCLLAFGRVKSKKDGGRYAFTAVCFFCLTALFGGALIGVGVSGAFVWLGLAFLSVFALGFVKKLYEKRARAKFIYDCTIAYKQREIGVSAFYDSGNFALYNGVPVCFVSPVIAFEFYEADGGETHAETTIKTMSGEKKVRLFKGALEIKEKAGVFEVREVYFAVSPNMLSREYELLLNSRIFEERTRL